MMYGYYGNWGWGSIFGGFFMLLFWIVIIFLIVALIRSVFRFRHYDHHNYNHHMGWGGGRDALDILRERYAKGEINKEEFEAKKKDLMG